MPVLSIIGEDDPFLHVALQKGESLFCESDSMVMMEDTLDLSGRMQGGLVSALMRRMANGESFFQQHIEAKRGPGDCLLSPQLPGALQILDVGPIQYCISDDAYVAATAGVEVTARLQSLGNALFARTGGFFIGQSSGDGQLVVSGFGSVFSIEVTPGKDVIIDNGHVVAWDSRLSHRISVGTSQSRGLLGNLVHGATSGEGLVLTFSGQGRVILCSRNRGGFIEWLSSRLTPGAAR
jgi:uncharacterized protein (TIGR00266 family)